MYYYCISLMYEYLRKLESTNIESIKGNIVVYVMYRYWYRNIILLMNIIINVITIVIIILNINKSFACELCTNTYKFFFKLCDTSFF